MAKDAFYFSHDSNARQDPKILSLINVYGMVGYAWFWILVEMLREQEEYKLNISNKYVFNALAMQMQCDTEKAKEFVYSCINDFELFKSDGNFLWSESLLKRMTIKNEKSEKAKKAAQKRWENQKNNAENMQMQCDSNAEQCECNAIKGKESKGKESKVNEINNSPKNEFLDNQIEIHLAKELFRLMRINNPSCKEPNFQNWAKHIDLMIRVDKRDANDIKKIIEFSQKDNFWQTNILSTDKLRKQFDKLILQANKSSPSPKNNMQNVISNIDWNALEG